MDVPQHYVVPPKPFSLSNGINVAEVEFPVYYNYFIKTRQTNIITTDAMATALRVLFHETMFGTPGQYSLTFISQTQPSLTCQLSSHDTDEFTTHP
jgi:hypothetical protein